MEKVLDAKEIENKEGKNLVEYELYLKREIKSDLYQYLIKNK